MSSIREPRRALLTLAAALALLLSAGLLPAFGGAAPAGDLAREIGRAAGPVSVDQPGLGSAPGGGASGPSLGGGGTGGPGGLGSFGGLGGLGGEGGLLVPGADGGAGSGGPGGGGAGGVGDEKPAGGDADGNPDAPAGDPGGGGFVESLLRLFDGGEIHDRGDDGASSNGTDAGGEAGNCQTTNGYVVCLPSGSLTPGQPVPARITRDDAPAADVPVRVDGQFVGRTGPEGRVLVPVPYAEQVRITVGQRRAALSPRDPRAYSLARQDEGVTVAVRTDVGLAVETADPDPGEELRIRATFGDEPASGLSVFVDGEQAAVTGADGRATLLAPDATEVAIRAERGDVSAERPVALFDPSVRTKQLVALPGTTAGLVVTEGGEPLADATVTVDGTEHRTDANGTTRAALPMAPSVDVNVGDDGVTATVTKRLWPVPVAGAVIGLAALIATGLLYRRSEATGRGLLAQAAATLSAVASALLSWLVSLAANAEGAVRAAGESLRELFAAVETPDLDPLAVLRERTAALLAWLDPRPGLARVRDRVTGGSGTDAGPTTAGGSRGRIEDVWARFVAGVEVTRPSRRSPGEVAEAAVTGGFPRRPVERLTEAFRAVQYADADPAGHVEDAEDAADELEAERGADGSDAGRDADNQEGDQ